MFVKTLLALGLVAVFAAILWRAMRPAYSLKVVIKRDGIAADEGLPLARRKEVLDFLTEVLAESTGATIYGQRLPDGRLHLKFQGDVSPESQQRIRNFLITVM
jgi:hypothetical protein